jgi:RHS repeat-associated protein
MQLSYDARHRLTHIDRRMSNGEHIEADYAYDALSRRIRKTVIRDGRTTTTRFGWDGDRIVAEETDDRTRTVLYEPGSFVPLVRVECSSESDDQADDDQEPGSAELRDLRAMLADSGIQLPAEMEPGPAAMQIQFFHTDHLGTPLMLTDATGDTLWRGQPDDWSAIAKEAGDAEQDIRFQGQWVDRETGLYYNWHRHYDPSTGRYTQIDPIGLAGGLNTYSYALSNPTRFIDPMGLDTQFSLGINGNILAGFPQFGFLGAGIGGGTSVGINIPTDLTNWRCYQGFMQFQGNLVGGVGAFAGVGVSAGFSTSDGPLPLMSSATGIITELNAGWGIAGGYSALTNGGSVLNPDDYFRPVSGGSVTALPRAGAGYGFGGAVGQYRSATLATPTIGDRCASSD